MAANDNLVDLAVRERDSERTIRDQARQQLSAAQADERTARDEIALEVQQIHQLELAGDKPAEVRRRRIRMAELRRAELRAAADARAADDVAQRASARLAEWEARLVQWTANRQEDTVTWPAALAARTATPGQARTLSTNLDTRVEQVDVPAKLLAAVRARVQAGVTARTVAEDRVAAAEDLVARLDEKNGGTEATAAMERRAYARARADVAAFLRSAGPVMAAGTALLAEALPAVPAAAKAKLEDPAQLAARNTAADAETALRNAEIDEAEKLVKREKAELRVLREPTYDPATDLPADPIGKHDQAVTLRQQKQATFTPALQERVLAWQAEAPAAVWSYVARVEEARAALDLLDVNLTTLRDDLIDAHEKLANALDQVAEKVGPWRTGQSRLQAVQLQRKATLEAPPSLSA
jgi:hypothetical protein